MVDTASSQVETDLVKRYRVTPECSKNEFLAASRNYARSVVENHAMDVSVNDLDWQVSYRAQRRAGVMTRRGSEPINIRLTWEYFENMGWDAMASVIRHELIHVHLVSKEGDDSHGKRFKNWAEKLDTPVNCEVFSEPKWWIVCEDCDAKLPRYQTSKVVKFPNRYDCGDCGGDLLVKSNE